MTALVTILHNECMHSDTATVIITHTDALRASDACDIDCDRLAHTPNPFTGDTHSICTGCGADWTPFFD